MVKEGRERGVDWWIRRDGWIDRSKGGREGERVD